ncbi:LysR family transcriptional regulator [Brenneria tiliae]|uniref:LysR family transcriptional regulator n=1 Tax=Brenneria tiliae TaxID=2914984 RepID=A0ABT0MZM1_9GAMM|nr:LysR family transcriptional regulator [Brenneria tiliae]MCL2895037.1 LysR family transcriptional regulator [Brenneria tiliae]
MRDLPPTAMLRAFEVATRHTTFTSSAAELFITQSAVSHQLKNLEEIWGLQLFERGKTLSLTPVGAALAPIVREFFSKLETTLADLVPKWDVWFKLVGINTDGLHESVRFADTNMTIEAALLGQGIALARSGHVEKEINDGSLVRLFAVPFPSPAAYYFVCPRGIETQPHIMKFRSRLLAESQQMIG